MLPKGSRLLAKGGTRHLRFLIPPLATPPDLPPAAAPCGRAAKSGAANRVIFHGSSPPIWDGFARDLPRMTVRGRVAQVR